jgi:hypothetical protein
LTICEFLRRNFSDETGWWWGKFRTDKRTGFIPVIQYSIPGAPHSFFIRRHGLTPKTAGVPIRIVYHTV